MCVHAVKISESDDLTLRVLNAVIGGADAPCPRRVSYCEIARGIGTTEETVRYHIRKLVRMGYLRVSAAGYEPTGKVLFLPDVGDLNEAAHADPPDRRPRVRGGKPPI